MAASYWRPAYLADPEGPVAVPGAAARDCSALGAWRTYEMWPAPCKVDVRKLQRFSFPVRIGDRGVTIGR